MRDIRGMLAVHVESGCGDTVKAREAMMGASALSRISAIDNAVPAQVIGELRAQIIESQTRRPKSSDGGTYWYSLDTPARLLFEQVIQHLRSFVPRGHEFIGAEWWFR